MSMVALGLYGFVERRCLPPEEAGKSDSQASVDLFAMLGELCLRNAPVGVGGLENCAGVFLEVGHLTRAATRERLPAGSAL